MASGLPVADRRTRIRRRERDEPDEPDEPGESSDNPYRITGIAIRRFILLFFVIYAVLAVSIFSVFALQDQVPELVGNSAEKEIQSGEEASFTVLVRNPSILEKEFSLALEKELPSGWLASLCDETQCFYEECALVIGPRQEQHFTVNIIADTVGSEGCVRLLLYFEGTFQKMVKFSAKTREKPHFTAELIENTQDQKGVLFRLRITNTGNVPDWYTVFVPSGVSATVSESTIELEPGEEKDFTVYIEENQNINTSVVITSQSGLSETLYLICERNFHYDFELYSAREFYIDQPETEVTFDIINMGDASDVYRLSATCLSPEWEAHCYPDTVAVDSKKSERIRVLIKRGEGRSTSVIVTATSESGLSKNIKMSIYVQETQGKTVLAEYFTGTWCYVCSYGERALRTLAEEFDNLIVLVYHLKDDIETPGSQRRTIGVYGFTDAVSTMVVNGMKHVYYSSGGEGTIYFRYKRIFEALLSESLRAEIYISGRTSQNTAYVTAEIHSNVSGTYDVWFVLFKNDFEYRGETKQYIVRDTAIPQRVFLSQEELMVSCEFTLPEGESFEGYGVVVIVQHPETLEVIQANSYML